MRKTISLLLLICSWLVVFFILMVLTEFVLAPWDTAIHQPEIGTWQRTVNDFFVQEPGNLVIASLLIVASIYLTWRQRAYPLWALALGNVVFAVLVMGLFMGAAIVNNAVFPYPPVLYDPNYHGYHRAVIPGLIVALVCTAWLRWQIRLSPRRSEP
jgi:hypothetical protein